MILKNKSFLCLSFILFLTPVDSIWANENKIQTISTEDQFLSILDKNDPTIILCSMDHCPHCKIIGPELQKHTVNPKYKKITFAQTNGPALHIHQHVKRETDGKFKIPGYPVFLFIKDKKIHHVMIGASKDKLATEIKEFAQKL